jgi:hypothetical protein
MYSCQRAECTHIGFRSDKNADSFVCATCLSIYCSKECKESDKGHNCYKTSKGKFEETMIMLGYSNTDNLTLPVIRGTPMFGFPGPISGVIPKKMIPIREQPFSSMLTESEKTSMHKHTEYFYLVLPIHLYGVWSSELAREQKLEIKYMIEGSLNKKE